MSYSFLYYSEISSSKGYCTHYTNNKQRDKLGRQDAQFYLIASVLCTVTHLSFAFIGTKVCDCTSNADLTRILLVLFYVKVIVVGCLFSLSLALSLTIFLFTTLDTSQVSLKMVKLGTSVSYLHTFNKLLYTHKILILFFYMNAFN